MAGWIPSIPCERCGLGMPVKKVEYEGLVWDVCMQPECNLKEDKVIV